MFNGGQEIIGAALVAQCLRDLGIKVVFGLTGYPITAVLEQIIHYGIKYIGFRNEQAASYAATAYGYLTRKPACCIVVGGPGVVHAMAGVINSSGNRFPLLLLAGSSVTDAVGLGNFQELDAVSMLSSHVKVALRPHNLRTIPFALTQAYRMAWYGRPGTAYVDLPADVLESSAPMSAALRIPQPVAPQSFPSADDERVARIAQVLRSASAPLVVIGKGCAYAQAEGSLRHFIDTTELPFLPTPMGKGCVPDSHPCNVSSKARSTALRHADVVLVLGARLNWILHFGLSPKWNAAARIIQVDIDPNVIGQTTGDASLGVVADVNRFLKQLISHLEGWKYPDDTAFRKSLQEEKARNELKLTQAARIKTIPLKFEHAYEVIRTTLDSLSSPSNGDIIYIAEGARTMDVSRAWFYHEHPRTRLDAGTHGTMGVGFAYAIASWEAYNGSHAEASRGNKRRKKIVGLMGDSATGFAAMEIETMARCGMDCLIFVMNNGGVYHGHADSREEWLAQQQASKDGDQAARGLRSWSLGWETRYDLLAEAVGGKGFLVRSSEELRRATEEGFKAEIPVIINVLMESGKGSVAVFGFSVPEDKERLGIDSKL